MEKHGSDLQYVMGLLLVAVGSAVSLSLLVNTGRLVVAATVYVVSVCLGCLVVAGSFGTEQGESGWDDEDASRGRLT